MVIGFFVYFVF